MMALVNVTRTIRTEKQVKRLFSDINACFPSRSRVGILAPAGAGKSTLARLLCGIEKPDSGHILAEGRISWPMGFAGGFHPDLTLGKNIALLGQMIGESPSLLVQFCGEFCGLTAALGQPTKMLSPTERLAVAFSLSLAVPCDTYVADDTIGFGDSATRRKSEAMLASRLEKSGLIFLSRNPTQLAKFCDQFWVLLSGQLVPCRSPEVGMKALNLLAERDGNTLPTLGAEARENEMSFKGDLFDDNRT